MFQKIILKDTYLKALEAGVVCLKSDSDGTHAYITKNHEFINSLVPDYQNLKNHEIFYRSTIDECDIDPDKIEMFFNDENYVFDINQKQFCKFLPEDFSGEVFAIASAERPEDDMFLVDASLYLGDVTGPVCVSDRLLNTLSGVEVDFGEIGIDEDSTPMVFDIVLAFENEKSNFKSQLKGVYLLKEKKPENKEE